MKANRKSKKRIKKREEIKKVDRIKRTLISIKDEKATKRLNNRPVEDADIIAHRIAEDLFKLKDNLFYHFNMTKVLDKRISVESHNLEIVYKMPKGEEKERLRQEILVNIEELSEERRWHKDQHFLITKLSKPIKTDNGELNLTHLINLFNGIQQCNKKRDLINPTERNEIYVEEELRRDLDNQFAELRENYDNVFLDKYRGRVIAYNNSEVGRKFYQQL